MQTVYIQPRAYESLLLGDVKNWFLLSIFINTCKTKPEQFVRRQREANRKSSVGYRQLWHDTPHIDYAAVYFEPV